VKYQLLPSVVSTGSTHYAAVLSPRRAIGVSQKAHRAVGRAPDRAGVKDSASSSSG